MADYRHAIADYQTAREPAWQTTPGPSRRSWQPRSLAERDRRERAKTFQDPGFAGPIRQVAVIEDQRRNGEWVVEYFDADGAPYITIFAGPEAERRARDYFRALRSGAVKTVREGTTEH